MGDFLRGLHYYVLNTFVANIPFNIIRLTILRLLGYQIDRTTSIHVGCTFLGKGSQLYIGENTTVNTECVLDSRSRLEIGSSCSISRGVLMLSLTHDHRISSFPLLKKEVIIGDGVWIGANAIIIPGVNLGSNCVVGAGSVVTKNFPPYSILAGNPAKKIGTRLVEQKISKSYVPWFGKMT